MKRNLLAVVIGLAAAIAVFLITETINGSLHPAPTTLNYKNEKAVTNFYENQPLTLWLLVLAGWSIGAVLCGFLIKRISKNPNKRLPVIAGTILTVSAVANFFSLPHPTWFVIVGLIIFIPSTLFGHSLHQLKSDV